MAEEGGPTPQELLFRAAKTGRFDDFRQILFSSKLRLNVTDGLGNTALHYAAAGDHPAICKFILKTDPQVINIPNNIGDTPLHKAAGRAKPPMMEILLSFGADVMTQNQDGLRPQDVAKASSHSDPRSIELLTPASLGSYSDDDDDMDPFKDDGDDGDYSDEEDSE